MPEAIGPRVVRRAKRMTALNAVRSLPKADPMTALGATSPLAAVSAKDRIPGQMSRSWLEALRMRHLRRDPGHHIGEP